MNVLDEYRDILRKVCNKCGVEQPETNYSKKCDTPDGLRYTCKDCDKTYREGHKEQKKAYNNAHGEQISRYMKQYHAVHSEDARAYHAEHREARNQQGKAWLSNNRDRMRITQAIWQKNHPNEMRAYSQSRKAKKSGLASTLTPAQWKHILTEFVNTCAYCGAGEKMLHQEHFIALSSGGEYGIDNIIPACITCNSSKGAKDFFTWYPTFEHYDKQRERKIMRVLHYTGAAQQLTLWTAKGGL